MTDFERSLQRTIPQASSGIGVERRQPADLAEILERVLNTGIVIAGEIRIDLLDIELLTIKLRLVITSLDRAEEVGLDWWRTDPWFSQRRLDQPGRGNEPLDASPSEHDAGPAGDDAGSDERDSEEETTSARGPGQSVDSAADSADEMKPAPSEYAEDVVHRSPSVARPESRAAGSSSSTTAATTDSDSPTTSAEKTATKKTASTKAASKKAARKKTASKKTTGDGSASATSTTRKSTSKNAGSKKSAAKKSAANKPNDSTG